MKIANLEDDISTYIQKYIKKEEFVMKSLDYIRKTLPNEFNWSILYQLFKEDEIELSETAEDYLRTTPQNTNLAIFEEILTTSDDSEDQYSTTLFSETVTTVDDGSYAPYAEFTNFKGNMAGEVKIIINNKSYICSPNGEGVWCYGAPYVDSGYDFSQYPFRIEKHPLATAIRFYTPTAGTYTVTVKIPTVPVII